MKYMSHGIYTLTHSHTQPLTHTYTHSHTHSLTHTHKHTHNHTHSHTHTLTHTHMQSKTTHSCKGDKMDDNMSVTAHLEHH